MLLAVHFHVGEAEIAAHAVLQMDHRGAHGHFPQRAERLFGGAIVAAGFTAPTLQHPFAVQVVFGDH